MHYNTWPPIVAEPSRFASDAAKEGNAVRVLRPGESLEL